MVHAVLVRADDGAVHVERHSQFLVLRQKHSIVGRLRFLAVILAALKCTIRIHRSFARGTCALRFLKPRGNELVGAHADSVMLVLLEIIGVSKLSRVLFADLNGTPAHGQRHVDGGGWLSIFVGFFKVIAEAGVLPLAF